MTLKSIQIQPCEDKAEAEQVSETPRPRRVGRSQGWRERLLGVNPAGAAPGADLGGSSKFF